MDTKDNHNTSFLAELKKNWKIINFNFINLVDRLPSNGGRKLFWDDEEQRDIGL